MAESPQAESGAEIRSGLRVVSIASVISAVSGFVALTTSVYTLVFLVKPNLKPREQLGASVSSVTLERGIDFQTYWDRTGNESRKGDDPKAKGTFLYLEIDIRGLQERVYGPFLTVIDAKTLKPVVEQSNGKLLAWRATRDSPATIIDKITLYGWVEDPKRKGEYFVRVRLYNIGPAKETIGYISKEPKLGLLDVADSKRFRVV